MLIGFLLILATAVGCGSDRPPGTVICHYNQQDSIYVGSPSLCILPDGTYIASHDEFGPGSSSTTAAVTRIYRSEDRGEHWRRSHASTDSSGRIFSCTGEYSS